MILLVNLVVAEVSFDSAEDGPSKVWETNQLPDYTLRQRITHVDSPLVLRTHAPVLGEERELALDFLAVLAPIEQRAYLQLHVIPEIVFRQRLDLFAFVPSSSFLRRTVERPPWTILIRSAQGSKTIYRMSGWNARTNGCRLFAKVQSTKHVASSGRQRIHVESSRSFNQNVIC